MQMYTNGKWRSSGDSKVVEVFSPTNKQVIDTIPFATKEDVEDALKAAKAAQKTWARTPLWKRAEIMTKCSELIRLNIPRLSVLLSQEVGKPIAQSEGEIETVARLFSAFAEQAKRLYGMNIPLDHQQGVENDIYLTRKEPLGVIVGIVPFNFPAELFAQKVAPALATGNTVIIKPANVAALTILEMTKLIYEAGLPDNALQVITGSGLVVGEMLTQSPLVNGISLTGSTETGIKTALNAAKNLSRLKLELGGNDPLIVFSDADIELAVDQTVFGRTLMNGQTCCANKRMIIHRSKVADFTDLLADRLKRISFGDPLNRDIGIGPLINQEALKTVHSQVQTTIQQGAKVLLGAEIIDDTWYPPTILTHVQPDFEVARDMEIFGPVFPIITFDSDEEAIQIANSSCYGLNASVFTRDLNRALQMSYQIESGIVAVNNTGTYRPDVAFFGGYKMSGLGREGLIGALEEVTQMKSVAIRNCLNLYGSN